MAHRFKLDDNGEDTLILVFPPAAIRALAERLAVTERLHGPLPDMMQTTVRGAYTNTTLACDSSGHAKFHKAARIWTEREIAEAG